jgi:hypothetical protein
MSLLGKILIFFNLLAAGAFVYFATQDWKGRQTISAAVILFKLPVSGLPFDGPDKFDPEDETLFRLPLAGWYNTETVSKKILDLYFQPVPGGDLLGDKGAVPNQLAEVRRVKAKIEALLKEQAEGDRVALLNRFLIDQSLTYEQRQEVQALVKAGNAPELEKRLSALFDAVLNKLTPATSDAKLKITDSVIGALRNAYVPEAVVVRIAPLKNKEYDSADQLSQALVDALKDDEVKGYDIVVLDYTKLYQTDANRAKPFDALERETRAAHLLTFLSTDPAWQTRVKAVVGLRRYVSVVALQTSRVRDMGSRLERLIVTEQVAFQAEESVQNQLARDRTDQANRQSKLKREKTEQKTREDDFVGQRKTQLAAIQAQLVKVKAEVDEALADQSRRETILFEVQREVAVTLDEIYRLEAVLAARERDLLKAAK